MLMWATEVIGAIFALFVVFVLAMRLIRTDREVYRLRRNRIEATMGPEEAVPAVRTPADDFHDRVWLPLCGRVAELAAQRMGRALKAEERRTIWRSRSQLVLEVLLKELAVASPGEAMALLRNAPSGLDRPDPTGWCVVAETA